MPCGASEDHPRVILQAHGLSPHRRFGQNFLVSTELMDRIVEASGVGSDTIVLEIGTGIGRLTQRLCEAAGAVVGVEIDRGLWELCSSRLNQCKNLQLIHGDFLDSKHVINPRVTEAVREQRGERAVQVVSNLPYQISSPALINLLEWEISVAQVDVMLQAEVVDRLLAGPGSSDYGPLTVFASYHGRVEEVMSLPPSAFWPRPQVSSKFIRIRPEKRHRAADYSLFRQAVNCLFQSRRKTIYKGLSLGWDKETARAVLERLGWEGRRRPAKLAMEDFVTLSTALREVVAADREADPDSKDR